MAGSAEQVLSKFQSALKSGDESAINSLISGNLQHDLDRGGMKATSKLAAGVKNGPKKVVDANVKILDTIASGDTLVVRFSFDVKGSDVPGADPAKTAHVNAICVAKTQNGEVVSVNIEPDTAGLYLQLGLGIADARATH
jgi:hypothetical protein